MGPGRRGPAGGIAGDADTATRDGALARWGDRPAMVFGDPLIARPAGAVQVHVSGWPGHSFIRARSAYACAWIMRMAAMKASGVSSLIRAPRCR